jgi:hypothetical protein
MKRLNVFLVLALAVQGRAAVVERAAAGAGLPSLPPSAVVSAPSPSLSPSLSAPALLSPSFLAAAPAAAADGPISAKTPAAAARARPSMPDEQFLLPGAL